MSNKISVGMSLDNFIAINQPENKNDMLDSKVSTLQNSDVGNTKIANEAGELHCENGPAVIYRSGLKEWYINGKLHREDGPAKEYPNGTKEWYFQGKKHRLGAPARIAANGDESWFFEGQLHRDDGPAVVFKNGDTKWYRRGSLHREDGPALNIGDTKEWYLKGCVYKKNFAEALARLKTRQAATELSKKKSESITVNSDSWLEEKRSQIHQIVINNSETPIKATTVPTAKPTTIPEIDHNGTYRWYEDNNLHNEKGPAVVHKNGMEEWYKHGKLHRIDGPAYFNSSLIQWWYEGKLHRVDGGPAIELRTKNGISKYWYKDGKLHRLDGPAMELESGVKKWFVNDKSLTEREFRSMTPTQMQSIAIIPPYRTSTTEPAASSPATKDKVNFPVKVKRTVKNWPDAPDEMVAYDEIYAPIKRILEEGYRLVRHDIWDFEYDSYELGKAEKQVFPKAKEQFSKKYLKAVKEKYNSSLFDVSMRMMFLLGMEQGRRAEYKEHTPVRVLAKGMEKMRESNKNTRYQLARALATLRVKEQYSGLDERELNIKILEELEKTRQVRLDEIRKDIKLDPSISSFKTKVKKKVRLSDLIGVASTLDPEIVKMSDWENILKDASCTIQEWKSFCNKKNFHKFVG